MTIALRYQGRLTFDISRFFHTDQRYPTAWTTGAMLASNCPGSMAFPPDVLSHSGGHVRTGVASFLPRKVVCEGRPYLPACWKPVLRGCRAGGYPSSHHQKTLNDVSTTRITKVASAARQAIVNVRLPEATFTAIVFRSDSAASVALSSSGARRSYFRAPVSAG
jgi:hypothetical protein